MKGKTAKLAAAAVILIVIAILTNFFAKTATSVVLAGVLDRVEQARAFKYRMDMTITESMVPGGIQTEQATCIVSNAYGMKYEMDMGVTYPDTGEPMTQKVYILPDQKAVISLMPQQKICVRAEMDEDLLAEMKTENNDPRVMIKDILECEYTELGRSEINGVEVEGFETMDPKFSGGEEGSFEVKVKLWVDVETWLPVQMETDVTVDGQAWTHEVTSDFQWDIQVVASDFEPVIPDDYTLMTEDEYTARMMEEAALEGLKLFADIYGKYPKKIDRSNLTHEFLTLVTEEGPTDDTHEFDQAIEHDLGDLGDPNANAVIAKFKQKFAALQNEEGRIDDPRELSQAIERALRNAGAPDTEVAKIKEEIELYKEQAKKELDNMLAQITESMEKAVEKMAPFQTICTFHVTLVADEKEPVYYGETVGPDDAGSVLMRWKVADGRYRVVFGDLRTADVTSEELAALEKP
ncbi:MAG: hypothetical protein ACYSWO_29730 [Planctomycetota bacterium]